MGCTCENNKPEENIEIVKQPKEINPKLISSTINIQSHLRGYLFRKKLYEQYLELVQNDQISSVNDENNNNNLISETDNENFENINNSNREEDITEQDMSYLFSYYPPLNDGVKVIRKPTQLTETGVLYSGEWDEEGNKHGRGVQLWPDGAKYYGYWIKNRDRKLNL